METDIKRLKREALKACCFRNHTMGKWINCTFNNAGDVTKSFCSCDRCGKTVYVTIFPAPNDIDIGGEAVALNCN